MSFSKEDNNPNWSQNWHSYTLSFIKRIFADYVEINGVCLNMSLKPQHKHEQ